MSGEPVSRPATVRDEEAESPSVGRALLLAGGALFWGWLAIRLANDWIGGLVVPEGEPFVPPAAVESLGVGVPLLGGALEGLAFALTYLPQLAAGIWLTLVITGVSVVLGFCLAVPLSVARVYGRFSAYLALAYTELFRGTPLLAQLFVLHFGLNLSQYVPELLSGVFPRNVVWVAVLGFVLNGAAYQSEYIRAALESVDAGQLTAGRAIGLSKLQAIRFVVLPQGLRYAIPGWSNELVYLIKYSSLAAFITVPELYYRAFSIASSNFRYTAVFTLVGLVYLALVITASKLMAHLESATAIPGLSARGR